MNASQLRASTINYHAFDEVYVRAGITRPVTGHKAVSFRGRRILLLTTEPDDGTRQETRPDAPVIPGALFDPGPDLPPRDRADERPGPGLGGVADSGTAGPGGQSVEEADRDDVDFG